MAKKRKSRSARERTPTGWEAVLRKIRSTMGLSQAKAAGLVGVAKPTWVCWEHGYRTPSGPAQELIRRTFPTFFPDKA
jgi:DNA-binding transcriptional regulator YiaG